MCELPPVTIQDIRYGGGKLLDGSEADTFTLLCIAPTLEVFIEYGKNVIVVEKIRKEL